MDPTPIPTPEPTAAPEYCKDVSGPVYPHVAVSDKEQQGYTVDTCADCYKVCRAGERGPWEVWVFYSDKRGLNCVCVQGVGNKWEEEWAYSGEY